MTILTNDNSGKHCLNRSTHYCSPRLAYRVCNMSRRGTARDSKATHQITSRYHHSAPPSAYYRYSMSHAGQGELSDRSSKRCMACGYAVRVSQPCCALTLAALPPLTPTSVDLCCSPFVLGGMPPAIHSPCPFFPLFNYALSLFSA